jgi:phage terminase large subunit-like protein
MRRLYRGGLYMPKRSEFEQFARFCRRHLRLEDGRPLVVEGFQRRMLADYFAGTTETIILCPKKQGKSTIVAAIALFHLVTTPDAECVIVAASREQAGILFNQAAGFVRRSEWLRERVKHPA